MRTDWPVPWFVCAVRACLCAVLVLPRDGRFRKKEIYEAMLPKLNISIPKESREEVGKPLLKVIMQGTKQK